MIRETVRTLRSNPEPVATALVGGFLLSVGTVLATVPVLGYLVRVLERAAGGDPTSPTFDDWPRLVVDGARGLLVWVGYLVVPLGVFFVWVYAFFYRTDGFAVPGSRYGYRVANGVMGTTLVSPLSVNNLYEAAIHNVLGRYVAPPDPTLDIALLERVSLGAFLVATALHAYVTPAALAHVARTGSVRSGFDLRSLEPVLTSRVYLLHWTVAAVLWLLGVAAQLGWLAWRWSAQGNDSQLQAVGIVPVVVIPTVTGVVSTFVLLLAAFVGFPLLVFGYALVGRAYGEVHGARTGDTARSEPAEGRRPRQRP